MRFFVIVSMYGYMFFNIYSSPHLLPVPYSLSSHMLLGKCVFSHALPSPPLVSLHQGESYEFLAKAKILDEIQNQIVNLRGMDIYLSNFLGHQPPKWFHRLRRQQYYRKSNSSPKKAYKIHFLCYSQAKGAC
uniref:Uncharacterized protein n=1 Tax=Micrurus lemniscatus lemniscatus TaxID=129467 RepID=A0A2D4HIU7_MICLE